MNALSNLTQVAEPNPAGGIVITAGSVTVQVIITTGGVVAIVGVEYHLAQAIDKLIDDAKKETPSERLMRCTENVNLVPVPKV